MRNIGEIKAPNKWQNTSVYLVKSQNNFFEPQFLISKMSTMHTLIGLSEKYMTACMF